MLILEIAAGIILAAVVLAFWPVLLIGAGVVAVIAVIALIAMAAVAAPGVAGGAVLVALAPIGIYLAMGFIFALANSQSSSVAKFADRLNSVFPDWTDKSVGYMIANSLLAVCAIGGVVKLCAWLFK